MEKENHGGVCKGCCSCDWGTAGGGMHFVLRWLLGLVVIMLAFCLGVQIGEIRSALGESSFGGMRYGHSSMMAQPEFTRGYMMTFDASDATAATVVKKIQ